MIKPRPKVFTIAPSSRFLQVLAQKILQGFPLSASAVKPPLSDWTILLPTKRAVREFNTILAECSGREALLLPRVQPLGDLDEDRLQGEGGAGDLPNAMSRAGQLFTVMTLLQDWAIAYPQVSLAREISGSPAQSLGLATSLLKLVDQFETEESDFVNLQEAYGADLSEHRNAILTLIELLQKILPQKLEAENLVGPMARRSMLIRLEARRVATGIVGGPIIAAGSTGTIPATRALLKAIAGHPKGAVVLPGLDQLMDEESWDAITAEHPQFTLKNLIGEIEIARVDVGELAVGNVRRNWFISELMRPSATAERWHINLKGRGADMSTALQGVKCVEAPNRHHEARTIALILREALETPGQTAALITPDRDLAKRVKAELLRFDIVIDDSAGEPLIKFGLASLTQALLDAINEEFSPASLIALLAHPDCDVGLGRDIFLHQLRHLEIAVLRGYGGTLGLDGLYIAMERALESRQLKQRVHPLVAVLRDEDWDALKSLTHDLHMILSPLTSAETQPLGIHVNVLMAAVQGLAPSADLSHPENIAYGAVVDELRSEAWRFPKCDFFSASIMVLHALRMEPYRNTPATHPRLAIYGVLEARLIPVDVAILGGLNEGIWPALTDPGPWFNRTMRSKFELPQPERDIGSSAHDFNQGLGYPSVYLTWSKRVEGSPQNPSRWVLRLRTVAQTAAVSAEQFDAGQWSTLAAAMDQPAEVTPHSKPKPTPSVEQRPTRFSVSTVEKLIRDPYAVYASKILRVEPLPYLFKSADAPLRGMLFHEAIARWNQQQRFYLAVDPYDLLLEEGKRIFAPLQGDPEITSFWWPRFKRMALWLGDQEIEFRKNTSAVHAEIEGEIGFDVAGVTCALTARADRIDLLKNGRARIVDYKTGLAPSNPQVLSGMKPQLPLEAAILAKGGFKTLPAVISDNLVYMHISGNRDAGKIINIKPAADKTLTETGLSHLNWFKSLLAGYQIETQPYYPRANMFKEEEASDYDHLSRYAEWILAGSS